MAAPIPTQNTAVLDALDSAITAAKDAEKAGTLLHAGALAHELNVIRIRVAKVYDRKRGR